MSDEDIELYGDPKIASMDAAVPKWLIGTYVVVFFTGILWLFLFWDGAYGWFDRGYWFQLEKAANTTYPWRNLDDPADPN